MNTLLIALIILIFVSLLVALFVGGILKSAAMADEPTLIEPHDFDDETNCAWCQKERAIKSHPNQSHGICERHKNEMLADARRINHAA